MRRLIPLIGLLGFTSCMIFQSRYSSYPENPFEDIKSVLVLPFLNQTGEAFETYKLGKVCANELRKYPGFQVLYPQDVMSAIPPGKTTLDLEEVLRLGRAVRADAILVVRVNDYDPYDPPMISLTVQMLRLTARALGSAEMDELTRSASWHDLPVQMPSEGRGHLVGAFDAVYDAHSLAIQSEIEEYMDAQNRERTGFHEIGQYLMVQKRFIQFVSSQLLNRLLEG